MATIEARGYVNKLELKTSGNGVQFAKFTLAVQQKRKDKTGQPIVEKLYFNVVDFDPKDLPADGDYVGVTGYVTLSTWGVPGGKGGINVDVTAKSYEKLTQLPKNDAPRKADVAPPSDPFRI